jgi:hypothetical protein
MQKTHSYLGRHTSVRLAMAAAAAAEQQPTMHVSAACQLAKFWRLKNNAAGTVLLAYQLRRLLSEQAAVLSQLQAASLNTVINSNTMVVAAARVATRPCTEPLCHSAGTQCGAVLVLQQPADIIL